MKKIGKIVERSQLDDHYLCTDIDRMEEIAKKVPLSAKNRPGWDEKVLKEIGFAEIRTDERIWQSVWSEEERLNYASNTNVFSFRTERGKLVWKHRRILKLEHLK